MLSSSFPGTFHDLYTTSHVANYIFFYTRSTVISLYSLNSSKSTPLEYIYTLDAREVSTAEEGSEGLTVADDQAQKVNNWCFLNC
jgi:hypothetical protein